MGVWLSIVGVCLGFTGVVATITSIREARRERWGSRLHRKRFEHIVRHPPAVSAVEVSLQTTITVTPEGVRTTEGRVVVVPSPAALREANMKPGRARTRIPAWVLRMLNPEDAERYQEEWDAHLWQLVNEGELKQAKRDRRHLAVAAVTIAIAKSVRRVLVGAKSRG